MNRISPYPGLRPFSEEEAIFFRGRENHISQIIQSLENNHFVMITGASGDGKSSIVYACLLYTSPSPRDPKTSRMPSSA